MKPSIIRDDQRSGAAPAEAEQRVLGELGEQRVDPAPRDRREPSAPQQRTGQIERDALDDLH